MTDRGTVIPLPSRPFERPMPLPVTDRRATVAAYASLLTAATDVAEADPAQRIAADPSIIDAERHPLYGNRVPHWTTIDPRPSPLQEIEHRMAQANARREAEALRQSRLSR